MGFAGCENRASFHHFLPMHFFHRTTGIGLAFAIASVSAAHAAIFSFDSDAQGWSGADNNASAPFGSGGIPLVVDHHAPGGNPGGYISITDPSDLDFYFVAPASVMGNQSAAYGTALTWDLKVTGNTYDPVPDAVLSGAGIELVIDVGPAPAPNVWTSYSITLSEGAGWRKGQLNGPVPTAAEFQAVLASLDGLRIRGEYFAGGVGSEVGALDNVGFAAAPEPAAWMSAVGLVCASVWILRRGMRHSSARGSTD